MTIAYIVATVFLSSFRISVANYDKLGSLHFPFVTRKFCFIADGAILVGSIYYLNWWIGLIVFALHFFSVISATLGWPFAHFYFKCFKDESIAVRNSEGVMIYAAILYVIFVVVSFFVVDYASLYHAWTLVHTIVLSSLAVVGFIIREILAHKQKKKSSVNTFVSSKAESKEYPFESIKKYIAELFVTNYMNFQSSLLDTYGCKDFLDTDFLDSTLFLTKLCMEYAALLYEITFYRTVGHISSGDLRAFGDYYFCTYLACTSDAYEAYKLAAEDFFTDEGVFNGITYYYSDILLQRIPSVDLLPAADKPQSGDAFIRKLFDIFCTHCLFFLYKDKAAIGSNTVFPQIDDSEQIQRMEDFIGVYEAAKDYDTELNRFYMDRQWRTTSEVWTMEEQKVLLTAKNGTPVWVPMSKVGQWQKSQAQEPNAEEMQALKSGVRSLLESLISEARRKQG